MEYAAFKKDLKLYAEERYDKVQDINSDQYIITNGKSLYRIYCTPEHHLAMQLSRPLNIKPSIKLYELVNNINKESSLGSYFITSDEECLKLEYRGHIPLTVHGTLHFPFACSCIDEQFIWMETVVDVLIGNLSVRKFHELVKNPLKWKKIYTAKSFSPSKQITLAH